jgi:hypothetical protein
MSAMALAGRLGWSTAIASRYGEARLLRLRDDVERAWAQSVNSVAVVAPPAAGRSAYS